MIGHVSSNISLLRWLISLHVVVIVKMFELLFFTIRHFIRLMRYSYVISTGFGVGFFLNFVDKAIRGRIT